MEVRIGENICSESAPESRSLAKEVRSPADIGGPGNSLRAWEKKMVMFGNSCGKWVADSYHIRTIISSNMVNICNDRSCSQWEECPFCYSNRQ